MHLTAVLTDGRRVTVEVRHAIGSLENPLSDAQLEAKFNALVHPVLGTARAEARNGPDPATRHRLDAAIRAIVADQP